MFVVFSGPFDVGEVVFDGVEIRRIGRQEKQGGSFSVEELFGFCAFVERHIIHDDHMIVIQYGAKLIFQPGVKDFCIAGSLKQEGSLKGFTEACSDQGGARPFVS